MAPAARSRSRWDRQLDHYPANGPRALYLTIVVLATVTLYYELYVQGAVGTSIIADFHMSFKYFVYISVFANAVGAFASLVAGLADRWGRANLVVYGTLITGLLVLLALPHSPNKWAYLAISLVVGFVEGIILVATPALVRDFSPQLGRASAMGFWTLGPVLGSLIVTEVATQTLDTHSNWRFQFYVCGIVGLAIFVFAFFGLRELSPGLRDQLMVSLRDRALIEARAQGIDPDEVLTGHWRQMLKLDVIGSAFAISVLLLIYYTAVAFSVVYFATTFGYSESRANSLANWYWISNAIALVIVGVASDRLRVRKPFMIVGAAIMATGVALFATRATQPSTTYYTFAVILMVVSVGSALAFAPWMASFTETVEKHNPAATATGLAVWGWIIRVTVAVSLAVLAAVVSAATPLVERGPTVQALAARYATQLTTAAAVDPATLATLSANPTNAAAGLKAVGEVTAALKVTPAQAIARLQALGNVPKADLAYLQKNAPGVQKAAKDGPKQWRTWWWICFGGVVAFIPFIFGMTGRWSPRKAREDAEAHERLVERELQALAAGDTGGRG